MRTQARSQKQQDFGKSMMGLGFSMILVGLFLIPCIIGVAWFIALIGS